MLPSVLVAGSLLSHASRGGADCLHKNVRSRKEKSVFWLAFNLKEFKSFLAGF
jgi:hypothetical protein